MTSDVDLTQEERKAFVGEARDQIDESEQILLEMEAAGDKFGRRADDGEKLAMLFRAMHTIKGNAATVGLSNIEKLAHVAEDMMEKVRAGQLGVDEEMADLMLGAVDQLRVMLEEFAEERPMSDPSQDLLKRMRAKVEGVGGGDDSPGNGASSVAVEQLLAELSSRDLAEHEQLIAVAARLSGDADLPAVRALQCIMACEEQARDAASHPRKEDIESGQVDDVKQVQCLVVSDSDPENLREAIRQITGISDVDVAVQNEDVTTQEDDEEPSDAGVQGNGSPQQIRVDVSVLDRLMNLSGEMVINRNRLSSLVREAQNGDSGNRLEEMQETVEEMGRATMDLQEDIMEMRLLPLDELFRRFPRMMRNLHKSSAKRFHFAMDGGETEIDRSLMEIISDPLTHMLRNAVDHGIEPPEVRAAAGKDPEGEVRLTAHRNESNIVVQVSDDGAGIDVDALRDKAQERGLLSQVDETISDDELLDVIFSPGFSTSDQITEISGRGVGLDVAKRNIESVNGNISLENEPGKGTSFRISLPLTVTTVKSLLVRIAGQVYVVPLSSVRETLDINAADVQDAAGKPVLHYQHNFIPIFGLHDFFPDVSNLRCDEEEYLVVLQADRGSLGLQVDDLLGEEDCVIKPLSRPVDDIPGISAATILPDGNVALILDAGGLFSEMRSVERSAK